MNKQIENIIRNQSSNLSLVSPYKGPKARSYGQWPKLQYFLKLKLTTQWENFLINYKDNNKFLPQAASSETRGAKLFFYKKEKFCEYNYFILAKLINFIGVTPILQNKVRQLVKIHNKHLELEKLLKIKLAKNSIFFYWISFVLMKQMYKFVKMYSSFLCKSNLIPTKNKLEIQNKASGYPEGRNFLFFKCPDFFMLKWYQNKINVWSFQVLCAPKSKETLNNKNNNSFLSCAPPGTPLLTGGNLGQWPSQINTIFYSPLASGRKVIYNNNKSRRENKKNICYSQNKTNNIRKQLLIKTCFAPAGQWIPGGAKRMIGTPVGPQRCEAECKLSKQKYLRLIKKVLRENKITTQLQLIQRLNEIIGNWDTFVINTLTKTKSIKLNLIVYQLLWRWGLSRHRKQRARWIKNRYWQQRNKDLVFSVL
jgi:hypothetical protein